MEEEKAVAYYEQRKRERKRKRETIVAVVAIGAVALARRRCRSQLSTPSLATVHRRCYCPRSSKPLHLLIDLVAVALRRRFQLPEVYCFDREFAVRSGLGHGFGLNFNSGILK